MDIPTDVSLGEAIRKQLSDSLERFNRERYTRAAWRAFGREPDGYAIATWSEMAEMGWFALGLPQGVRGTGSAVRDLLPLFIAAGQGLWREPLLPSLGDSCGALLSLPASDMRDRLLSEVIDGRKRLAFPIPASGSSVSIQPRPGKLEGYRANGRARFVIAATSSTEIILTRRCADGLADEVFVVARHAPGVRVTAYPSIDQRMAGIVDLSIAPATLIGTGDAIRGAYRRSTVLAAAEAVGIMMAVNSATIAHLQARRQFDQRLSQFQVLRHRVVELRMQETETSALLWAVARAYDESATDLDRQLLQLRILCSRTARTVTQQAIQLHGGMGMAEESFIGAYYKHLLMLSGCYLRPDEALQELAALQ